jgi:hypothetical protein
MGQDRSEYPSQNPQWQLKGVFPEPLETDLHGYLKLGNCQDQPALSNTGDSQLELLGYSSMVPTLTAISPLQVTTQRQILVGEEWTTAATEI